MSDEINGNGGAMAVFNTAGIALSVDDFGTGYSSLAQLKSLNVQELKIDRAFVTGLKGDPTDRAVCAAIITMARELKLRVVGEGIEDAETAAILADLGCDVGQGFYYQRPVPADQILGAIAEIEAMTVDGIVSRLADRTKWNGGH